MAGAPPIETNLAVFAKTLFKGQIDPDHMIIEQTGQFIGRHPKVFGHLLAHPGRVIDLGGNGVYGLVQNSPAHTLFAGECHLIRLSGPNFHGSQ